MARARTMGLLRTDRLVLRRQEPVDAVVFHQLWTERDVRVPPHRRLDEQGRPTVSDVAASITRANADGTGPRLLTVVLKESGDAIGYCGLTVEPDTDVQGPGLAYELLQAVHGKGYATEASGAVVIWAREAGYRQLQAGVWDWNLASRRVLSKLGFREVGRGQPRSAHGETVRTILTL